MATSSFFLYPFAAEGYNNNDFDYDSHYGLLHIVVLVVFETVLRGVTVWISNISKNNFMNLLQNAITRCLLSSPHLLSLQP